MIELRWVLPAGARQNTPPRLQYRAWHIGLDAGGAMTPAPFPIEWLEWQDVPYVTIDAERAK